MDGLMDGETTAVCFKEDESNDGMNGFPPVYEEGGVWWIVCSLGSIWCNWCSWGDVWWIWFWVCGKEIKASLLDVGELTGIEGWCTADEGQFKVLVGKLGDAEVVLQLEAEALGWKRGFSTKGREVCLGGIGQNRGKGGNRIDEIGWFIEVDGLVIE